MMDWKEGGFVIDETKPLPYCWGSDRTMIPVNRAPEAGGPYLKGLYACIWDDEGEVKTMHFSPDGAVWLELEGYEYA